MNRIYKFVITVCIMASVCALVSTESQVRKVMDAYRKEHPNCESCGLKPTFWNRNPDVHHILSRKYHPALSAEPTNFICLCRSCHWIFGHCKTSWKCYNPNIRETIRAVNEAYSNNIVIKWEE